MLVFKYRSGDKETFIRDLEALQNNYLWASNAESLNDPCETRIDSESFKNELIDFIKAMRLSNESEVEKNYNEVCKAIDNITSRDIGIFSLSKTHLDELLWAYYANSHKGFCIGYDLGILTANNSIRKYYSFDVTYTKSIPRIDLNDINNSKTEILDNSLIKKFVATKSERWIHEKEIRLIADKSGQQSYDYRAVKSIYFGLRMSEADKNEIMKRLEGRGVSYFQIMSSKKSYEFYEVPVDDKYKTQEVYMYKIAPVSENSVLKNEVKKEYKKYIDYLYKAIEIARREPYCEFVYFADFKFYEEIKENPDVFVHCKKLNDDFPNYFYTFSEIEEKYNKIKDINK